MPPIIKNERGRSMRRRDVERLINSWNDKHYAADGDTRNWIMLYDGDDENKYRVVWCGNYGTITKANTYSELYENLKDWIERI